MGDSENLSISKILGLSVFNLANDGVALIFWVTGWHLFTIAFENVTTGGYVGIFLSVVLYRLVVYLYRNHALNQIPSPAPSSNTPPNLHAVRHATHQVTPFDEFSMRRLEWRPILQR
jgi:hypothetical protein